MTRRWCLGERASAAIAARGAVTASVAAWRRRRGGGLAGWLLLICSLAWPAAATAREPVALYASPTSRAFFASVGGNYEVLLQPWRTVLASRRITAPELSQVVELARLHGGVLVLPSAVALNAAERQALLRFRSAGGSLLATWAIGTRDERGQWVGYDFARELLGVAVTGEIDAASPRRFLIPFGDSPVNRVLPAGHRIWIGQVAETPLTLEGGMPAAVYMDWSRTVLRTGDAPAAVVFDEAAGEPGGPVAASAGRGAAASSAPRRTQARGGRRVVFGFAETAWDFQPSDLQALAGDALQWLRRVPTAHLGAWPRGQRAAQVIELDTEEGFANAAHFVRMLDEIGVRGTLYCLTSEARRNAELVRGQIGRHEVAFHGEVHVGFKGLARDKQKVRLRRMLAEMGEVLGVADGWPVAATRGFRAPTEGYDATTEELLHEFGIRHHAADPNSSSHRLPFFSPATSAHQDDGLVVLPRGQLDDLNYLNLRLTVPQIAAALVGDFEFNASLGGLALLSVHSQNMAHPDRLLTHPQHNSVMYRAMDVLVRHIGRQPGRAWVAPAGEVADWWRERSRASLEVRSDVDAVELWLTVAGPAPVSGLTVLLPHPAAGAQPVVAGVGTALPGPEVLRWDRFTSALVFGPLPRGRHAWRVSWR